MSRKKTEKNRLTELDETTCRQLLASRDMGRVAVNAKPSPEVLPVTYAVRDGDVYFQTAGGVKWDAVQRGLAATFEVDGINPDRRSAWSVVVRGRLEVADDADIEDLPKPLPGGVSPHLARLIVQGISGRRIPAEKGLEWAGTGHIWKGKDASDLMG